MSTKALGLAVLLTAALAAPADAGTQPRLPAPTGQHTVGTTTLHLVDHDRQDPWVPEAGPRELLVTLWYPARPAGEPRARYMTPVESELLLRGTQITGVPGDALSRTLTHSRVDAAPTGRRLPLVVLSPGFTWPRSSLTGLAEDLASRGYVVAAIDHSYENFGMTFPDGRLVTCAACALETDDFGTAAVESRARDVSFVLDELTGPAPKWRGSARIDRTRIAMAGSSLGGAAVGETMLTDPRVLAGVNLDGTMFKPLPETGLARPIMFFGEDLCDPSWVRDHARASGWKRWLTVAGSVHASFTDYDLLAQQIGVDLGGTLPGTRSATIVRAYVGAFLDLHLRDRPQPLLTGPAAAFPEVAEASCGA